MLTQSVSHSPEEGVLGPLLLPPPPACDEEEARFCRLVEEEEEVSFWPSDVC
jgi:hypothetical protein